MKSPNGFFIVSSHSPSTPLRGNVSLTILDEVDPNELKWIPSVVSNVKSYREGKCIPSYIESDGHVFNIKSLPVITANEGAAKAAINAGLTVQASLERISLFRKRPIFTISLPGIS